MFGKKKIYDFYVCGSMRNYPELNYPTFHKAAKLLRQKGFTCYNPAEHDGIAKEVQTFAICMKRDLDALVNLCDGIALLPGWRDSLGANAEAFSAFVCGKNVVEILFNDSETDIGLAHIDLSGYRLPYKKDKTNSFNPHECELNSFGPQAKIIKRATDSDQ